MGRVKTAFSCDWQEVNHVFRSVFSCFYVVHEGQFYCDFEFSLGFTVYSWHVGVRKRFRLGSQRAQNLSSSHFFRWSLHLRKVRTCFLQQGFSNYICLPSPLPCANVRPNEVIQFLFIFWARCQLIGSTGFDHTPARVDGAQVRERYYPTPPHPTPAWRDTSSM